MIRPKSRYQSPFLNVIACYKQLPLGRVPANQWDFRETRIWVMSTMGSAPFIWKTSLVEAEDFGPELTPRQTQAVDNTLKSRRPDVKSTHDQNSLIRQVPGGV